MGSEQQETKSLPRNRKCGNCRFFEPAPLWRKGWCRNPRLYPPHANHLVDSTSIDCEGGFRSRVYWEPLPVAAANDQPTPSMGTAPVTPRIYRTGSSAADSGQDVAPQSGFFKSLYTKPPKPEPEPEREEEFFRPKIEPVNEVVEAESVKDLAEPEPPATDGKDWRVEVRRILPFTQKWPLERINPMQALPWVLVGFLALVMLFIVVGGNKDKDKTTADQTQTVAIATQNARLALAAGTPSITATTPAATPTATASALKGKSATISGLGGDVLRLRAQPNISSDILDKLKDGDKVKILDGPVNADQLEWYKIEAANGKVGWVVKKYVVIQQ